MKLHFSKFYFCLKTIVSMKNSNDEEKNGRVQFNLVSLINESAESPSPPLYNFAFFWWKQNSLVWPKVNFLELKILYIWSQLLFHGSKKRNFDCISGIGLDQCAFNSHWPQIDLWQWWMNSRPLSPSQNVVDQCSPMLFDLYPVLIVNWSDLTSKFKLTLGFET